MSTEKDGGLEQHRVPLPVVLVAAVVFMAVVMPLVGAFFIGLSPDHSFIGVLKTIYAGMFSFFAEFFAAYEKLLLAK